MTIPRNLSFLAEYAGASRAVPTMNLPNVGEVTTVSATAATGTVNFDVITQSVLFYTTSASGNWTLNIRGDASTSLNTMLAVGQSVTIAFFVTQGATAYYASALTVLAAIGVVHAAICQSVASRSGWLASQPG